MLLSENSSVACCSSVFGIMNLDHPKCGCRLWYLMSVRSHSRRESTAGMQVTSQALGKTRFKLCTKRKGGVVVSEPLARRIRATLNPHRSLLPCQGTSSEKLHQDPSS